MPPVAKKPAPASKTRGKKKPPAVPSGPVVYAVPTVEICAGPTAMTAARFKELLGWEEESETVKFGADYTFALPSELGGAKIRLTKNVLNRPVSLSIASTYKQEILQRRWYLNGEPAIWGVTGQVLSAQHRGIGLVMAALEWEKHRNHWEANWPTEPTMDLVCVFGIQEDAKTINTLDTGRPRTLADVLFHSPYFAAFGAKERKEVARMTDYAIRTMWKRTGASDRDAFCPYRTHAESIDFLDRHPRLLEAVKHISEENAENVIGKFISPGAASALLYLMASCGSDLDEYANESPAPSERKIDFKWWDKATEFWVLFGSGNLLEVRHAIAALSNEDGSGAASLAEKIAVFVKAWAAFRETGEVAAKDVKLKYTTDDDGIRQLVEFPDFGGIDVGDSPAKPESDDPFSAAVADAMEEGDTVAGSSSNGGEPTQEELEAAKADLREEHRLKMLGLWTEKVEAANGESLPDEKSKRSRKKPAPVVIEH